MDDNDMDIEMRDFEQQTFEDDVDEEIDPELLTTVVDSNTGRDGMRIVNATTRRSYMSILFLVLAVVAVVTLSVMYVAPGLFISEEQVDALVETFESESGTVSNNNGGSGSNNKFKTALDKKDNNNNINGGGSGSSYWSKRHKNPFANPVTKIDGSTNSNSNNVNGNKGPRGSKNGGVLGGKHPKIGGGGGGGGGGGKNNNDRQPPQTGSGGGDEHDGSGTAKTIQSDPPTMTPTMPPTMPPTPVETIINNTTPVDVDEAEVYCEDLSQYQDWYDANVTLDDGVMYKVHEKLDHDAKAFTQGLTYARGKLFESTGLYGQSTVRVLDKDSADVEHKVDMEPRLFGEGMTFYKDKLVQITWKSQEGFIYSMDDLRTIDRFKYTTTLNEGWGITWDRCNDELIVTDGSVNLHFWDPETMAEKRKIPVIRLNGTPAKRLNEIEFWRGRVLANVWFEDVLLVINPTTGLVEKEYDFKSLWPQKERKAEGADVFNGISVSDIPEQLYVTGKLWNRMFEIELLP
mmetsp:Transcript_60871/g.149051  ORF Transcript_60871/g.149051 Transcript_60871/m.149051 type:complete len:517 (-) Transcript_60871:64-1614(-)